MRIRQSPLESEFSAWISMLTFSLTTLLSHLTTLYFPQVVTSRRRLHSLSHFWRNRSVELSNADEPVRQQIINSRNTRHDTCATFEHPVLRDRAVSSGLSHFIVQLEDFDSVLESRSSHGDDWLVSHCGTHRQFVASPVHVAMINHGNGSRDAARIRAWFRVLLTADHQAASRWCRNDVINAHRFRTMQD